MQLLTIYAFNKEFHRQIIEDFTEGIQAIHKVAEEMNGNVTQTDATTFTINIPPNFTLNVTLESLVPFDNDVATIKALRIVCVMKVIDVDTQTRLDSLVLNVAKDITAVAAILEVEKYLKASWIVYEGQIYKTGTDYEQFHTDS